MGVTAIVPTLTIRGGLQGINISVFCSGSLSIYLVRAAVAGNLFICGGIGHRRRVGIGLGVARWVIWIADRVICPIGHVIVAKLIGMGGA